MYMRFKALHIHSKHVKHSTYHNTVCLEYIMYSSEQIREVKLPLYKNGLQITSSKQVAPASQSGFLFRWCYHMYITVCISFSTPSLHGVLIIHVLHLQISFTIHRKTADFQYSTTRGATSASSQLIWDHVLHGFNINLCWIKTLQKIRFHFHRF